VNSTTIDDSRSFHLFTKLSKMQRLVQSCSSLSATVILMQTNRQSGVRHHFLVVTDLKGLFKVTDSHSCYRLQVGLITPQKRCKMENCFYWPLIKVMCRGGA